MRTNKKFYLRLSASVAILIVLSLLFQITLANTLHQSVLKEDAIRLFHTYHLYADTQYYPSGFWTRIKFVNISRNDYEKHLAVAKSLETEDKILYGDQYIIQGASPYGKDELQIQANSNATPEKFMALVRRVQGLDQSEPFLRYSPKIFYTYTALIPGIYMSNRLRHDPKVTNVETGITSIPLQYLLTFILSRK